MWQAEDWIRSQETTVLAPILQFQSSVWPHVWSMWTAVGMLGRPCIYISKSSNSPHFTRSKPELRGGVQGSPDGPYWSQPGPHPMQPSTSVGLQEIFQHLWPLASLFVEQERWTKSMLEVFSSSEQWCAASGHSITTWNDPIVIALRPHASLWTGSGKAQLIGPHRPCWAAIEHKNGPNYCPSHIHALCSVTLQNFPSRADESISHPWLWAGCGTPAEGKVSQLLVNALRSLACFCFCRGCCWATRKPAQASSLEKR